jgi:hypothetical protein
MTVDYSVLSDAVVAQLTAALPEALTVLGIILAVTVGIKFFRRVGR